MPSSRFKLFRGERGGWVLRDLLAARDYPFYSRPAALLGAARRRDATDETAFLGTPTELAAYGPSPDDAERFDDPGELAGVLVDVETGTVWA